MSSKRWVCLDPALHTPEQGSFRILQNLCPEEMSYHLIAFEGMSSVYKEDVSGIVILGSAASVLDDLPWQKELIPWLTKHIDQGTPILAICYAHQLIGHMFGARVIQNLDGIKHSGIRTHQVIRSACFITKSQSLDLVVSHYEQLDSVPSCFYHILETPHAPVSGMLHREKPIFTIQAHPEADMVFCKNRGIPYEGLKDDGVNLIQRFFDFKCSL